MHWKIARIANAFSSKKTSWFETKRWNKHRKANELLTICTKARRKLIWRFFAVTIFKEIFPRCTFGLVILPQSPSQLDEPEVLHLRSCSSWKKDHYPIMQCFGWPSQFREKRGKQCTIPRERSIIRSSCSIWANPHKKWENCMDWAIPNPERKNVIPWCSIWVNPHNRAKKGGNYRERIIQGKKYKIPMNDMENCSQALNF